MNPSMTYFVIAVCLCIAGPKAASAQAAVEAGLGASRAAISSAPARGIGKSIAGLAGKVEKAADSRAEVIVVKTTADSKPAEPVVKHEDPAGIEAGLAYDEMVRRFG